MRRLITSAFVALFLAAAAAPALAGPSETAFLQRLNASWTGHGKLSGAESGPVTCRIVITSGGENARYQGRCSIPDAAAQAFNGSITYNDQLKRFESRSLSGTTVGVRRGDTLTFTNKSNSLAGRTYSTMALSPSSLVITFTIINQQGDKTTSTITFTR